LIRDIERLHGFLFVLFVILEKTTLLIRVKTFDARLGLVKKFGSMVDLFGNVIKTNPMIAVSEPIVLIQKRYFALLYIEDIKGSKRWILAMGLPTPRTWRQILGTFNSKLDAINKAKSLGFGGLKICNSSPNRRTKRWNSVYFPDEKDWASIYHNGKKDPYW
jgi:hypothetical protein